MSSKSPEPSGKLSSSVKPRHVTMISLGGTIGAGLFIGIAEPLTQAGPLGTILAYFAAGLVMLGTMMCLGELATSFPHSGSFQYYAYKFFPSPLISYTIGWMYWLSWVLHWPQDLSPPGSCRTKCGRTSRSGFTAADTSPYSHWSTCSLRAHLVNLNIGSPASKSLPSFSLSPAVFGSLAIKPQQPNGCRHCG